MHVGNFLLDYRTSGTEDVVCYRKRHENLTGRKVSVKNSMKSKRRSNFAYLEEIIDEVQFQDEPQSE